MDTSRSLLGIFLLAIAVMLLAGFNMPQVEPTTTSVPLPTHAAPAQNPTDTSLSPNTTAPAPEIQPIQSGIIIDHNCTNLSLIPDAWLQEAKKLGFHYAHTSHGSQIIDGLLALAEQDPKYGVTVIYADNRPPASLTCDPDTLCIYDGNPPDTYICPEDYWSTQSGINRTRGVADGGLFAFSMWSWCGQQSDNSEDTVQEYLYIMNDFEQSYPTMRFILMTGHTDGGSATLTRNNNMLLDYAADNEKVIFDFADIESYDPDGNYYPNTTDDCPWCRDWCAAHPDDCQNLPDSCAHSHPLNCKQKAQAFWWMMARLAGWDGEPQEDL